MKKILLVTSYSLVLTISAVAGMKKAEGYYVSSTSDKKYAATFLIPFGFLASEPNYERMQTKIIYLIEGEKRILTPDQTFEVSFRYGNKTFLMRSVHNNLSGYQNGAMLFLKVLVDGPVSLYNYYETHYMPGAMNPATGMMTGGGSQRYERLVLQYGSSELVRIRRMFFKKDVCEFFSDCPEVIQKVKSGELWGLEGIVRYYNATCSK